MSARSRFGAGVGMVLLVILGWATPVSAHPILLRSDPAPQTTVATRPDVVRLFFSEPVEAAFGAVQVTDVEGHRVDSGPVQRADGDRQLVVGVRLQNGTFSVSWRVSAVDGHSVHGSFGFYVGAPSAVAAVVLTDAGGADTAVVWGFGAIRFGWFAALCALVGLVVIRRWVWTPSLQATGLSDSASATAFRRYFGPAVVGAWVVLAVACALSVVFQTASVSGLSFVDSARPSALSETLGTAYGRLWEARMVLVVLAALPVFALARRRPTLGASPSTWIAVGGLVVGAMIVATALDGHARTLGRAGLEVPSLSLHLGAVAVWVGGLAVFMVLGGMAWRKAPPDSRARLARQLVTRFGALAMVAVVVLVATGVINAYGDFGAVSDLWRVAHGRVVAAKIVLLALALGLAARHRWVMSRRLAVEPGVDANGAVRALRRSGLVEVVILLSAVALAASLVSLVPGKSLALATDGPVDQKHQSGPYMVRLSIDPRPSIGDNEVHVSFFDAEGRGAAEVTATEVSLGPANVGLAPLPMRPLSPGHFVADVNLRAAGTYRMSVALAAGSPELTTFAFKVRDPGQN